MSNARTLASTINSSSEIVVPSGGINFADIQTAYSGATSEILDGYEEGTFQPIYDATASAPTVSSYGFQYGFYIKIGNLVHFNLALRANLTSTGSGNAIISGLPFNINSIVQSTMTFAVGYYENWTTYGPTIALGSIGTYQIALFRDNGASGTRITTSNYKTGGTTYNEVYIAGTYITN